jgi:hypothetical protein
MEVRVLAEIVAQAPVEGGQVDPTRDPFVWSAVPAAAWYEVELCYVTDSPSPTVTWFAVLRSETPQLRIPELPERERKNVRRHWTRGRTAAFRVAAFDADGRRIGTMTAERRFLIAQPLPVAP